MVLHGCLISLLSFIRFLTHCDVYLWTPYPATWRHSACIKGSHADHGAYPPQSLKGLCSSISNVTKTRPGGEEPNHAPHAAPLCGGVHPRR